LIHLAFITNNINAATKVRKVPYFLALQNTYTDLQIALFKQTTCLAVVQTNKTTASKDIILLLQSLLESHSISFDQIQFIAANQGPGAFTTLRVVIATVNGLSFASQVPLIGINSLRALLHEYRSEFITIALLNAFSKDVYYAVREKNNEIIAQGCAPIAHLFELYPHHNEKILFIGNGAEIHKSGILESYGSRAVFSDPMPETCTIQTIGLMGLKQWQKQENLSFQLQPIYLKQASF
jgi:tRNA threonylcarbamoyladenosine biosynthesis protein TsaB